MPVLRGHALGPNAGVMLADKRIAVKDKHFKAVVHDFSEPCRPCLEGYTHFAMRRSRRFRGLRGSQGVSELTGSLCYV
jgi:hypothetical protein